MILVQEAGNLPSSKGCVGLAILLGLRSKEKAERSETLNPHDSDGRISFPPKDTPDFLARAPTEVNGVHID